MTGGLTAAKQAQGKALEFLLGARSIGDGHGWKDFTAFSVESDEWVTAYAAHALAETQDRDACEQASYAWSWLAEQSGRHGPGLGYNTRTPQDADSTVWGCRLAAMIGRDSDESAIRSYGFLQACIRPDGGMATFPRDGLSALHRYIGCSESAIGGWTTSHACVTAAAAWLPGIANSADAYGFLAQTQQPAGSWNAYWWADDEYATAHATESLARTGAHQELLEGGVAWLANRQRSRSAFGLALRVLGIAKAGRCDFAPLLEELLALQMADGSWPASARLRIPPPSLKDPRLQWNWDERNPGIGSVLVDQFRVFTSATAVRALSSCLML
jgi:sporulenol synthase